MSNPNIEILKFICEASVSELSDCLYAWLSKCYEKVERKELYMYAEGDLPICLIAHMDTIRDAAQRGFDSGVLLFDEDEDMIHYIGGCCLDDRMGIFAIVNLVQRGYRPSVIFTDCEEVGGLGAIALVEEHTSCPFAVKPKYLVELDRCGYEDCVFYSCGNEEFQKYIESFDFKTAIGSFTDCLILGENWDIAATNLSIGYEYEHTPYEYGTYSVMMNTISKVCNMMDDIDNSKAYDYQKSSKPPLFDFLKKI